MSEVFVLDASAILCLIRGEPGADQVKAALPGSAVSAVNLSEVVSKMTDLGMAPSLIDRVLEPLQLRTVAFDEVQARRAGLLREATRAAGLSLGDRACLALTAQLKATALTTDQAWHRLDTDVTVALAR